MQFFSKRELLEVTGMLTVGGVGLQRRVNHDCPAKHRERGAHEESASIAAHDTRGVCVRAAVAPKEQSWVCAGIGMAPQDKPQSWLTFLGVWVTHMYSRGRGMEFLGAP